MEEVSALYHALLDAWNRHDAVGYAALFADDGYVVGFDGSEMKGRHEIEQSLGAIFADHETGRYVGKIRTERIVAGDVALLGAVAGLVSAGKSDLNPQLNAIQTLVANAETADGGSCSSRTRLRSSTAGRKTPTRSRTSCARSPRQIRATASVSREFASEAPLRFRASRHHDVGLGRTCSNLARVPALPAGSPGLMTFTR